MRVLVMLVLAGCRGGPVPALETPGHDNGEPIVIGSAIALDVTWDRKCRKAAPLSERLTSLHEVPDSVASCDQRPYTVTVKCSIKCALEGAEQPIAGPSTLKLRALELGRLDMVLTTRLVDGTDSRSYNGSLQVIPATGLALSCNVGATKPQPCAGTISATDPMLVAMALDGPRPVESSLLTINGRPVRGALQLSTLYPEAAVPGGGIAPGTYKVTLALGTVTRTWELEAR